MSSATPLILASASPRRRELLSYLGVAFTVLPASVDEEIPPCVEDPEAVAGDLAAAKARDVAGRYPGTAVLAADTIVVSDGNILGKPEDAAEAMRTLQCLRNRPHDVTTAVALAYGENLWQENLTSRVHMREYSDDEITRYVASGDPFDKAGSYAIQNRSFRPVERCEGCYCNVVGLPILLVQRLLERANLMTLNFSPPILPPECQECPLVAARRP